MAGMEHWLPLLEERLETLFDHLGENDLIIRDTAADQALHSRREAIEDYYQNRVRAMEGEPGSYRPLEPGALYLSKDEWEGFVAGTADPSRLALPGTRIRSGHRFRSAARARFRARARAAGQRLRGRRQARRRASPERPQGRARKLYPRRARAPGRPARGPWPQGAEAGRQLAGGARLQDPAGAARSPARPWLHHARSRGAHRAGHARRPPRPPPQEAQGRRRLPRRARDAFARRPRRPRRPRHRPLRGPDADPGQQGAARLRRARICARQQALRSGREYRAAEPLRQRKRRRDARQPRRRRRGSGASRG